VPVGEKFPHFRRTVVPRSSGLLDPEDEGITILRNVGNYLPNERVSHPRRTESLATPL